MSGSGNGFIVRAIQPGLELRTVEGGGRSLVGHFAVFDQWTEINSAVEGRFMERIAPGAFSKTFQESAGKIRCLFEHGRDPQIGNKVLGEVTTVEEDERGAWYEVALLDTSYTRDLMPGIEQGLYGSSFRFRVMKDHVDRRPRRSAYNPEGLAERTLQEVQVVECGPCTWPAYEGTATGLRSRTDAYVGEEREAADGRLLKRSVEYVSSTVWAMHPEAIAVMQAILAERAGGHRPTADEIRERIELHQSEREEAEPTDPVAVIPVHGPIIPRAANMDMSSQAVGIDALQAQFRAALADDSVRAIVLDIDSPGGSAEMVPEFAAEILAARGAKPIVAMANTFAASAAYWLAAAADEVVVTPSGEVGSIGVWSVHQDISAQLDMVGVKPTLVSAGKYKVERNPFGPLSADARDEMQRSVDEIYGEFVAAVAKGRGVKGSTVRAEFGEGRMVRAGAAVARGMADRVGTFTETLQRLDREVSHSRSAEPALGHSATASRASGTGTAAISYGTGLVVQAEHTTAAATTVTSSSTEAKEMETMTIEERARRVEEIQARKEELDREFRGGSLDESAQAEWDGLRDERATHLAAIEDQRRRDEEIRAFRERGNVETERTEPQPPPAGVRGGGTKPPGPYTRLPSDLHDLAGYRRMNEPERIVAAYQHGAREILDRTKFPHPDADREHVQEHVERLLLGPDRQHGDLARRIIATSSETYERAFGKMWAGDGLTAEEERALSETTTAGGFAVPFVLDATIIPTSNGSVNPFRQIARVESITTNEWKGVRSGGVTAGYASEASEVGDDAPTLAQPSAIPERADVFIPFSIEIGQDWGGLQTEMARMVQDAKDDLEADKFVTGLGHGSSEPEGLLVGATAVVATAGTAAFAVGDLYSLETGLAPRFRPRASIVGNRAQYNRTRQFDTQGGASLWIRLGDGLRNARTGALGEALLGYPTFEASAMVTTITANSSILTIGDFSYFLIVDRIGMNAELVPHLFATGNNRPSGQRGLLFYWRNTSDVLAQEAFKTLKALA
jgi:HK97 family phage major capsid protein/HK97 family phage prohead protease